MEQLEELNAISVSWVLSGLVAPNPLCIQNYNYIEAADLDVPEIDFGKRQEKSFLGKYNRLVRIMGKLLSWSPC